MYLLSVDAGKCEWCADCVTACPRGVLEVGATGPVVAHPEECIGCGVCLGVCRTGAVRMFEVPPPPRVLALMAVGSAANN